MTSQSRIRLARRHAGLSQTQLAQAVGVQRSAVSHWEATRGKNPNLSHLRHIALVAGVQFEWLATGRGDMTLSNEIRLDSVPTAQASLVDDPLELRMLAAFRNVPAQSRVPMVEIAEQLAAQRMGSGRERAVELSLALSHGASVARQSARQAGRTKLG